MILHRYLASKFFYFFFVTSTSLVLLINFVEFFERLAKGQASAGVIGHYIALNLAPTAFTLMPLCSWLAIVLVLWEGERTGLWQTLAITAISSQRILVIGSLATLFLSIVSFCCQELFFPRLIEHAEVYKQEQLKQRASQVLLNRWFPLDDHTFLHCSVLDLARGEVEGLSFIEMKSDFSGLTTRVVAQATLDWDAQAIRYENQAVHLPAFFAAIPFAQYPGSTLGRLSHLQATKKNMHKATWQRHQLAALSGLLSYVRGPLIAALTLVLFFFCAQQSLFLWVCLATYPLFAALSTVTDFASQHGSGLLLLLLPYALALVLLWVVQKKLA